jgi:hypothetical protein
MRELDDITGEIVDAAIKGMRFEESLHRVVNNLSPSAAPRLRVNLPAEEVS